MKKFTLEKVNANAFTMVVNGVEYHFRKEMQNMDLLSMLQGLEVQMKHPTPNEEKQAQKTIKYLVLCFVNNKIPSILEMIKRG